MASCTAVVPGTMGAPHGCDAFWMVLIMDVILYQGFVLIHIHVPVQCIDFLSVLKCAKIT